MNELSEWQVRVVRAIYGDSANLKTLRFTVVRPA